MLQLPWEPNKTGSRQGGVQNPRAKWDWQEPVLAFVEIVMTHQKKEPPATAAKQPKLLPSEPKGKSKASHNHQSGVGLWRGWL